MRSSDIFARFGGEEFVALVPCAIDDAGIAAERVRSAFAGAAGMIAGCPVAATVSVGAASAQVCADVVALLGAADAALYRAKANGRNRVERMENETPITPRPAWLLPARARRLHGTSMHAASLQHLEGEGAQAETGRLPDLPMLAGCAFPLVFSFAFPWPLSG